MKPVNVCMMTYFTEASLKNDRKTNNESNATTSAASSYFW